MRTYFYSWRRKLGVLMLVVACVFMAGWVRSIFIVDEFVLGYGNIRSVKQSVDMMIYLTDMKWCSPAWDTYSAQDQPIGYEAGDGDGDDVDADPDDPYRIRWYIHALGFGLGKWPNDTWLLAVPYWSIILSLTLLSAYLLLSKPRPKPQSSNKLHPDTF